MPYCFMLEDKNVTFALRRISGDELDQCIRLLSSGDGTAPQSIHSVRKSIKKLRGLLRLVKEGFRTFSAENALLRDTARRLSALRDTDVLLQTLDSIADERTALHEAVQQKSDATRDPAAAAATISACGTAIAQIRARVSGWTLDHDDFRGLRRGLQATHRAAQDAMRGLHDQPQDEQVHDWRKRVKDSQYQLTLLTPLWPDVIGPRATATDRLGEDLGLHHDLSVLRKFMTDVALPASERIEIRVRIAAEQARIMQAALPLGARLFAGNPAAMADQWADWWTVWRTGQT